MGRPGYAASGAAGGRSMAEDHRFPCPACGADLRFSPAEGALRCDHCGRVEPIVAGGPWASPARELDYRAALDRALPEAEMAEARTVHCDGCGAVIAFEAASHAGECPFCASPLVIDTGARRYIKPRGLLPFHLDEAAARQAMTDWLGRLWFAPNGLRRYARKGRRMQGIYVPYWTYDARTASRYRGQRGTVYFETRMVSVGGKRQMQQVPRTRWRPVSGQVARAFDDILVLAATSLPKRYTDALAPWDLSSLAPYDPAFLAGFRAEAYTVALADGFAEARAFMDRMIERDIRFDIGGDRQMIEHVETQVADVTFKHVLLPVWLAAYRYNGRTYRFVVNGRSGAVQGERPWSVWKILLAVTLGLLVAVAIGYAAAVEQMAPGRAGGPGRPDLPRIELPY
jgi:ribosomal protein S27E